MSTFNVNDDAHGLFESQRLQLLAAVIEVLAQAEDLGDGCREVLRISCDAFGADAGALCFATANTAAQPPVYAAQFTWPEGTDAWVDQSLANEAVLGDSIIWRPVHHDDLENDALMLAIPLHVRDAIHGVMILTLPAGASAPFDSITQQTLQIMARQLGSFIKVNTTQQVTEAEAHDRSEAQLQERLRESDQQLHEARLHYKALVEQIPVLTYTASLDDAHTLLYISPQVHEWLGYDPKACMAMHDWWSLVIHPDDLARVVSSTWRSIPDAYRSNSEYRMLTRSGQILWVRDDARVAQDEQGHAIFVQGAITDITARKQSQDEMGISLEREHELNELKTRFITTVSHEFRTPLSRILSAAELIERYGEKITSEKRRRYVDQIRTSITYMAEMLQQVLLVGNYEAGISSIDIQPANLDVFCAELVQQMQMTLGTRCRLLYDSKGDCLSARVDTRILKQILSNLLNNAIRYSTQPDPVVELFMECEGDHAIFRIVDHGIGIPEEDQPRIFDAFHRGSNVALIAGTGLGLAVVRNAVQAHRGEISFTSEVGKGTTFTVNLPMR